MTAALDHDLSIAYKAPSLEIPVSLKQRLLSVTRIPQARGLLGIAFVGPHLAVWSDAQRIKTLLRAAPMVKTEFQKGAK